RPICDRCYRCSVPQGRHGKDDATRYYQPPGLAGRGSVHRSIRGRLSRHARGQDMKKAKETPAKRRTKLVAAGAEQHIKVRMYNVGFGDSFLLRVPTDVGERRILIDCGYHTKGKGKFTDQDLVRQIKADLKGQPLDVVIATHRHQDHISGFGEKDLWTDI